MLLAPTTVSDSGQSLRICIYNKFPDNVDMLGTTDLYQERTKSTCWTNQRWIDRWIDRQTDRQMQREKGRKGRGREGRRNGERKYSGFSREIQISSWGSNASTFWFHEMPQDQCTNVPFGLSQLGVFAIQNIMKEFLVGNAVSCVLLVFLSF